MLWYHGTPLCSGPWFSLIWYVLVWFGATFMLAIALDPRVWFDLVLSGMVWYYFYAWYCFGSKSLVWICIAWYGLVLPGIIWPGMVKEPRAALNSTSSRRKRRLNLFKKGVKSICTLLPPSPPFVANFQKYLCQTNWDTAQKRQRTCLTFLHFVVFGK